MWLRLSEHGNLACLTSSLVKIRKHEGQISRDEGWRRQIVDSCAGVVSYFIRQLGGNDPLADKNADKVPQFFCCIEERLDLLEVFERRRVWSEVRATYFVSSNRLIGAMRFGERLVRSGYAFPFLRKKLVGSSLAEQLAHDWINRICAES